MTTRERFHAVVNGQPFDRLPIIEWAMWWNETIDRWRGEELPDEVEGRYALYRHFGQDDYRQHWLPSKRKGCPQPERHLGATIESMADYERVLPFLYPDVDEFPELWQNMAA